MQSGNLLKEWNLLSEGDKALILLLVDTSDIVSQQENTRTASETDSAYDNKLAKIERHRVFKILISNQFFKEAYEWLSSKKAPSALKTSAAKIRIIEIFVLSLGRHAERTGKAASSRDKDNSLLKLQKKASQLLEKMKSIQHGLDYPVRDNCKKATPYLEYIINYKAVTFRGDKTKKERQFFYDLVSMLIYSNLPRSNKLISLFLEAIGASHLCDDRNMRALKRGLEDKCLRTVKR